MLNELCPSETNGRFPCIKEVYRDSRHASSKRTPAKWNADSHEWRSFLKMSDGFNFARSLNWLSTMRRNSQRKGATAPASRQALHFNEHKAPLLSALLDRTKKISLDTMQGRMKARNYKRAFAPLGRTGNGH